MPQGVVPLSKRQLLPELIELQKAAAVLHQRVQLLHGSRAFVAGALAIAGLVGAVLHWGTPGLSIAGLIWSLVSVGLSAIITDQQHSTVVVAQEMFDSKLFNLPWNIGIAGNKIAEHDIHGLARRLRAGSSRERYIYEGWYIDTSGVPYPYDVLLCQYENLGWDTRLRRRYRGALVVALLIWSGGGVVVGAFANVSAQVILLQWYVPSLAAVSIALDIAVRQSRSISIRSRLLDAVILRLGSPLTSGTRAQQYAMLVQFAREVQDGIFLARLQGTRVPNAVYRLFRRSDEEDFRRTAERYRMRLRSAGI